MVMTRYSEQDVVTRFDQVRELAVELGVPGAAEFILERAEPQYGIPWRMYGAGHHATSLTGAGGFLGMTRSEAARTLETMRAALWTALHNSQHAPKRDVQQEPFRVGGRYGRSYVDRYNPWDARDTGLYDSVDTLPSRKSAERLTSALNQAWREGLAGRNPHRHRAIEPYD